jgi:polyisoprenoid-binding protein YceI
MPTYELGPADGKLTVLTGRSGMAARAGHDLVIEAEAWSATLEMSPDSPESSTLSAKIDATSLQVRDGLGGMKPLTDSDRTEIKKNITQKILQTDRNPEITFQSTAVNRVHDRLWNIQGNLTIVGATSAVNIPVTVDTDAGTMTAAVKFAQSSFGIKPYSGLMGALKVADEVEVRVEARVAATAG